jgi:hypothetical protein
MAMAQNRRRTKPGLLSDTARHVVLPSGIVSTGWPAVRDKCSEFGVVFDAWQDGAGRAILAKRADGTYACSIGGAVLSIPRQVGKTFLIGAIVFALCLLFPGLTVLWTAHRLRTADETFAKMQSFAGRRKVKPYVAKIVLGSGDEEIVFHNGSRILFGARERGFGRGFDDVDVEVFDEAQILTENAIDDMVPAMNQAANPLPIFTGTPPKPKDPSDVFTRKRADALAGEDEDTLFIEFSAERGCDPMDRKQWAKANPSFPHRTPESAMLRMRKNLAPESYLREALGIWDEELGDGEIPRWVELADRQSRIESQPVMALAVSPLELGPQWASFGLAGRRADGRLHVEALDHRAGTWWLVDVAKKYWDEKHLPLRVRKTAAEGAFIDSLRAAGVEVVEVSVVDAAQACGALIAAASFDDDGNPGLHHLDDPDLNKAVKRAKRRTTVQGASSWDEQRSTAEITALIAVTVAAGGVSTVEADWSGGFTDLGDLLGDDDDD